MSNREEIRFRWEDILQRITSPAKSKVNGRMSYICPLCGNGSGTDGDGITYNPKSPDGNGLKCFKCGFSGDILDLLGKAEGLTEFPDKMKKAEELLGLDHEAPPQAQTDRTPQKAAEADLTGYFKDCHGKIHDTDYPAYRGLSEGIINRFNLGYDPHFTKSTGGKVWEALIIPTNAGSYVARNTDMKAEGKDRYRKSGSTTPLNWESLQTAGKPVFVVEGEIDALSIIEAGGEAVGLGSTSSIDLFINGYVKKHAPLQPIIIAMDNDEAGQTATMKLKNGLEGLGWHCYVLDPCMGYEDANEALIANRESFKQTIRQLEESVLQQEQEAAEEEKKEYLNDSAAGHLKEFINGIADSVNTPCIHTGFNVLDHILDGGLYEGLYFIGAISSLGKTTLVLQIADQIAQGGNDVLVFSLEMSRTELMSKSISRHTLMRVIEEDLETQTAKTARGITDGSRYKFYSKEEQRTINNAIGDYSSYADRIFIHEGIGDIGVEEIRQTVEKHIKITRNTPVVFVDYLQILAPHDPRSTEKQNTDKACLELKRLSRDNKTPVIVVSSFNRQSYSEAVNFTAFKESGAIEYSSDVLIGLQLEGAGQKDFDATEAKRRDPRSVEAVILKNRNGKVGDTVNFEYYPLFNYFKETGGKRDKRRTII